MPNEPMSLSVLIPVYDEQENLPLVYEAVNKALSPTPHTWEIVFVDDGSQDHSLDVLTELAEKDPQHVRVVSLRRNFGQTAAIAAGIDHAQGDILVPMDADLQNDPSDIPMMLDKIAEGYDVVSGWRKNREDRFLTRTLPSRMANLLISLVTGVHLNDYGCTLKAYRREVITGFRLYGEMHRFIPVYAASVGARICEVVVKHHPRKYGKAKYGLERTLKVMLDLFTVKFLNSFSSKPIYLFGGAGLFFIVISAIVLLYLFVRRIFFLISPFDSPLFVTSLMFSIFGFQSILMGLIAELLMRTYHESQGKPIYRVQRLINTQPPGNETTSYK
jgi:glycosyltransferase involved in cell wall biosynthesis